jgi:transcriptional regulator with XRE-family HTH domain
MSQIQTVKQKLQALFPDLSAVIDEPRDPDGPWMLDVTLDDRAVNIEWRPHRGFGISSQDPHRKSYYGEGPDEILSGVDETVGRVFELIKSGESTAAPSEITLAELRERLRLSQAQLARRLRVSQAAVSELEKNVARSQLLTLRKVIKALGAELQVRAVLPNARGFTLKLPEISSQRLRRNIRPHKHQRLADQDMPLPQHSRTGKGNFRQARSDERAKNLAKDYPEFKLVDPRTKLGTLRREFGVTSISEVRRELRRRARR